MAPRRNYATSPLRSAWRLLPPSARRYLYTRGYALVAPSIARTPPPARAGLAIAGELSATTGIGEGARIMLRALASLGVQNWAIDVGPPWQPTARADLARLPGLQSGVPLVVHANAPTLPASLLRLPRAFVRASRIIGTGPGSCPRCRGSGRSARGLLMRSGYRRSLPHRRWSGCIPVASG